MIDIEVLKRQYFYFDEPVPYKVGENIVKIYPVSVKNSELFAVCSQVLKIDKNSRPSADIIRMSYLQFLCEVAFKEDETAKLRLGTLLQMCLKFDNPKMLYLDNKYYITNDDGSIKISPKQFDEISRIILFQNIYDYDDSYIDPDLKKSMEEVDAMKAKDIDIPTLERQFAIITSHTGISKKEQLEMTIRSHRLLFNEVYGEVKFSAYAGVSAFAGKDGGIDDWIYKKKHDKYEGYLMKQEDYSKSMGGDGSVKTGSAQEYAQYLNN